MLTKAATNESEVYFSTKPTKNSDELVFCSRARKEMMRSKLLKDRFNDLKLKLDRNVIKRKTEKSKVNWDKVEIVHLAKRKRGEDADDLG